MIKNRLVPIIAFFFFASFSAFATGNDTISTESGLKIVILENGTGSRPFEGDKCKIQLVATLLDGTPVESTYDAGMPFKFNLGDANVIPGLHEAIRMLNVGDKAVIIIPAHLAFGENGLLEDPNSNTYMIPPGATSKFEIDFLSAKTTKYSAPVQNQRTITSSAR